MNIKLKPNYLKCEGYWHDKKQSIIFVEKEEDINVLHKLLCEQDEYWEDYKHIIQVAPTDEVSIRDIEQMCQYCGRTDIFDVDKLKEKINFIIFQYDETLYR